MDPVSAIGLASAVLSFIDFGTKIISGTQQIYDATSGAKQDNLTLEVVVRDLNELSTKLSGPDPENRTESDKDLCELAAECKRLAEDLKQLLDRIKPKVKGSKWHSFVSALKNERFAGEKEELRVRLEGCRGQLHFKLNYVTSRDIQDKLKDVIESSTSSNNSLGELQASVEQLRSIIQAPGLDEATKSGLQALLRVPEKELDAVAQERVLNALKFDEMNHRFNQVSEAHAKTFKWIFSEGESEEDVYEEGEIEGEDSDKLYQEEEFPKENRCREDFYEEEEIEEEPSGGTESREEFYEEKQPKKFSEEEQHEKDIYEEGRCPEESEAERKRREEELAREKLHEEERRETRRKFLDWLSSGIGVFHFSAKLGAGKSTLMKLIIDNPHVQDRLQQWAGESRELVLASHFFWKTGTRYQKSFEGMCRALLYGVFQGRPELTRRLMPRHWKNAWSTPWQASKELQIHDRDVLDALKHLVECSKVDETCRFCFFIDGLDELEEESNDFKHFHLVRALNEWSGHSSGNIKFCVSSREYNVFLTHFLQEQRIRLHDLTKRDMEKYARDELTKGVRYHGKNEPDVDSVVKPLVDAIVERAQGIFLWVRLVVNDLCIQMENGSRPQDLYYRVDKLPEDIDRLFRHFLISISHGETQKAYRTLDVIVTAKKWHIKATLLSWNFLEEEKKDQPTLCFGSRISRPGSKLEDVEGSRKKLNNCLRGLVESTYQGYGDHRLTKSYTLDVAHRSVAEFLVREKKTGNNCHELYEFEALDALFQVTIFAWRYEAEYIPGDWVVCHEQLLNLLFMRAENCSDRSNWGFYEGLESLIEDHDPISEYLNMPWQRLGIRSYVRAERNSFEMIGRYISTGPTDEENEIYDEAFELPSLRHMLVQGGYDKYEISKQQTMQGTAQSPEHVSLLASCILTHLMELFYIVYGGQDDLRDEPTPALAWL